MFDGNGNWTSEFSAEYDRDNNIKILASRFDGIFIADLKESFENCITKDGQIAPVNDWNMTTHKIVNLAKGTNNADAVNKEQLDELWYIGDVKTSTRAENHGKWYLCNGQAISRTSFPELFELLGTNFGEGDGLTTFNLPDYRGKFLRGLGGNSAEDIYTTQAEGLPNITGKINAMYNAGTPSGCFKNSDTSGSTRHTGSSHTVGGNYKDFDASLSSPIYGANDHVTPINNAINYFIKAK